MGGCTLPPRLEAWDPGLTRKAHRRGRAPPVRPRLGRKGFFRPNPKPPFHPLPKTLPSRLDAPTRDPSPARGIARRETRGTRSEPLAGGPTPTLTSSHTPPPCLPGKGFLPSPPFYSGPESPRVLSRASTWGGCVCVCACACVCVYSSGSSFFRFKRPHVGRAESRANQVMGRRRAGSTTGRDLGPVRAGKTLRSRWAV